MAKPVPVKITVLPSSDLRFGGHIDYECSVPLDGATQAYLVVVVDGVEVAKGYSTTYPGGNRSLALGPTPMWQGGAGKGTISVVTYNRRTGNYDVVKGSTVAFDVAA